MDSSINGPEGSLRFAGRERGLRPSQGWGSMRFVLILIYLTIIEVAYILPHIPSYS